MPITDTDRKVLAFLSTGQKKAVQVGKECFAPPVDLPLRQQNHYTVVAGGHLRRLEKMGMVRRVRIGVSPNEKFEWMVAQASERELF